MKKDRFLTGILIFIGILVIAAVALFFLRDRGGNYTGENSPDGVVHDYVLALQNSDYPRAYGYLADQQDKPSYEAFRQAFLSKQLDTSSNALQIGAVHLDETSADAWVEVTILYAGSGLFDTGWNSTDRGTLIQHDGDWKITFLPYPYWGWDWYMPTPGPVKVP